jgi:hypothetical protein
MEITQARPFISLALVMLTYGHLGWAMSHRNIPLYTWAIIVIGLLLLVGEVTSPLKRAMSFFSLIFKTDARTLATAVFCSFLFFIVLAVFRFFLDVLLIVAATLLARVDIKSSGIKQIYCFFFLASFCLGSLVVGLLSHRYFDLMTRANG